MKPAFLLVSTVLSLCMPPLCTTIAAAADRTETYRYKSTVTTDADGPLDLIAELNYNDAATKAPIAVVMHGFSDSVAHFRNFRPNARSLRNKGFFAITVLMRGRAAEEGAADGVRDSGGVEIHDIYDAVEAVKADYAHLVDPTNVYITGYSGGGGNTLSALTKFPDYFRAGAAFFGMSDYGFDATNGWYNNGASAAHRAILDKDIGNPADGPMVIDRYRARASNLASKNNPYSEIHLFVNGDEKICPPINALSYRDIALAAASHRGEFNNIFVHNGDSSGKTYQDFNGNGAQDGDETQNWPHGPPNADQQAAAEQWFLSRLLAGSIPRPVMNDKDDLFVAGYVKTRKFSLWLGDGQNAAANLRYDLDNERMTFELRIAGDNKKMAGTLGVDTARMGRKPVGVFLNGKQVAAIAAAGQWYEYRGMRDGDVVELRAVAKHGRLVSPAVLPLLPILALLTWSIIYEKRPKCMRKV
ncbi:MAG: prolyl oligopeptidase family serine peptidase [Pirellulaceae bacterium]|nr:prolyl oligopeptidase family serine peptidase [Pirellulaceae bacterium]